MRALADGRVRWGFWPPGAVSEDEWPEGEDGTGQDSDEDRRVIGSAEAGNDGEVSAEEEESDEEEDEEDEAGVTSGRGRIAGGGFFAALEDDVSDSEEAEEDEDQSDSDNAERREQTR